MKQTNRGISLTSALSNVYTHNGSNGDEDEMHLLFVCTAYAEIRLKYDIFHTVVDQPNENHVRSLLACEDQMKLRKLS